MTRCDANPAISAPVRERIEISAADDPTLSGEPQQERSAWQDVVDYQLLEWANHPLDLEEDGIRTPTHAAIVAACALARQMRDEGKVAPLRVVPDGDGGIVFERGVVCERLGKRYSEAIEIADDGAAEYLRFADCRLVCRVSYALPSK